MKYTELASLYHQLETTPKRLDKTFLIAQFLKKAPSKDLPHLTLLLQGRIFPTWDEREIGVATRLLVKAINTATGISLPEIEEQWKKTGDLGIVAEKLTAKKKQAMLFSSELEVRKVFSNLEKLATMEGSGSVGLKLKLIAELLSNAKPLEARYIIRTVLGELRVGVGEGCLRDAIVWAFFEIEAGISFDSEKGIQVSDREKYNGIVAIVQSAYDKANDYGIVAEVAKEKGQNGLSTIHICVGKPVKVMLFQKAKDIKDAFERVGKPAAFEQKYDGFRVQIHRDSSSIKVFTRRLEDVTHQFPDIVKIAENQIASSHYIIDAEVTGIDQRTGKSLPFQHISQRIKRKYDIHETVKKIPVVLHIFDILLLDKKELLHEPFQKRRELLEKIIEEKKGKITLAFQCITTDEGEAEAFYKQSLAQGNEGIMAKNLEGIYKPGSRVGFGVKVKPVMETLDLVIVGAEWGEGKRKGWLTSFTVACRDDETGEFLEIGKVGTGIKELAAEEGTEGVTFHAITEKLKDFITAEKGKEVRVKPMLVIEIAYEEIQKSPTYSSGYALRFPRLIRLREDRTPSEISLKSEVQELYDGQRGR